MALILFARTSMGPWGGYVTGLAENMEYILTPAVIVVGLGGYLGSVFGTGPRWDPAWWLACYAVFPAFNIAGVELSFRVSFWITLCALAILLIFFAAPFRNSICGDGRWAMPDGFRMAGGVSSARFLSRSGSIWELNNCRWRLKSVLIPSEICRGAVAGTVDPGRICVSHSDTELRNRTGSGVVGRSDEPLLLAFRTVFGPFALAKALALIACTGLAASFHAIIYAYGRQIYSLSRAGYFPTWLSVTQGRRQTPARALIAGSALGYGVALVIHFAGQKSATGAILLNMAVFGAVMAYVLQMASFVLLRVRYRAIPRPYLSPLGVPGAAVAALIAITTLGTLFANSDYRSGVAGAAVWFVFGIGYFQALGRKNLVLSPEEEFALTAAAQKAG